MIEQICTCTCMCIGRVPILKSQQVQNSTVQGYILDNSVLSVTSLPSVIGNEVTDATEPQHSGSPRAYKAGWCTRHVTQDLS